MDMDPLSTWKCAPQLTGGPLGAPSLGVAVIRRRQRIMAQRNRCALMAVNNFAIVEEKPADVDGRQGQAAVPVHAENDAGSHVPGAGSPTSREAAMIKVAMVRLDGTVGDDVRLTAAEDMAKLFDACIVGLFLNILTPLPTVEGADAEFWARLMQQARKAGDTTEAMLRHRLAEVNGPAELRRFDLFAGDVATVATREARTADAFVTLRLGAAGSSGPTEGLDEGVLFGSGRHLFVATGQKPFHKGFDHALVAWNGSREATRTMAEALPYLHESRAVTVIVVDREPPGQNATAGADAVAYLKHHGIEAQLHRAADLGGVSATLIQEAGRLGADLIVMGGYGHSRLREWLLGGTTYRLLRDAPVPLVIAH
ncbi:universal stress protein [Azospirillum baldaniorum]|uniref:universal stress protein n=1 Tax=Azospirillum baldaniorum TaxID=1064539 RepID=UPI001FCFFAC0|nr:universal stress protein [Azospirillum baldaniorum]